MFMQPYTRWTSSYREMERLARQMNRLFGQVPARSRWESAPGYPAMNVWTNENSVIITAELPGVNLDDIEIAVEENVLTLRGNRRPEETDQEVTWHRHERPHGSFVRTISLPFRVEAGGVEATFSKGVLSINMPRAEEDRPRRITVRGA